MLEIFLILVVVAFYVVMVMNTKDDSCNKDCGQGRRCDCKKTY